MENQINHNYRETSASNRPQQTTSKQKRQFKNTIWFKIIIGLGALLIALTLVFAGKTFFGAPSEASKLEKDKYQAVFLDGGQVYFGKIDNITSAFVELNDVYYLNVNSQSQAEQSNANENVSLVKLGCELHGPEDRMVINRGSVSFWENLKDNAQVTTAIKQWKQQNPNGQDCATSGTGSQNQAPATDTQPAAGANAGNAGAGSEAQ